MNRSALGVRHGLGNTSGTVGRGAKSGGSGAVAREHDDAVGLLAAVGRGLAVGLGALEGARLAALGPGVGVVDAAVEDLAGAQGDVAVLLEVLGQRDELRVQGAE